MIIINIQYIHIIVYCCDSTKGVNRKFLVLYYLKVVHIYTVYIVSQRSGTEIYIQQIALTTP